MKRILSIDAGGVRGVLPMKVLMELEDQTGVHVVDLFDLVVGAGVGGILATALTGGDGDGPRYGAADLYERLLLLAPEVFARCQWTGSSATGGRIDQRYSTTTLAAVLADLLGEGRYADALIPTVIPVYDLEARVPIQLRSWQAGDLLMRDVACASGAVPMYFEPIRLTVGGITRTVVSGGLCTASPALCGYVEGRRLFPDDDLLLISLGTGELARPIHFDDARIWGQTEWAIPAASIAHDAAVATTDRHLQAILGDERYVRIQTRLDRASDDLDDASRRNLDAIVQQGADLIRMERDRLERVCARLIGEEPGPRPVNGDQDPLGTGFA